MGRTGGNAEIFGLSVEQTAALGSAFLSLGKTPDVASTAINAMPGRLATARDRGKKFQEGPATVGMSAEDMAAGIKKNPRKTLTEFLGRLEILEKDQRAPALSKMFGAEFSDDIALLTGSLDTYKSLSLVAEEEQYKGSMRREADIRATAAANKIRLLNNELSRLKTTLAERLLPMFKYVGVALLVGGFSALGVLLAPMAIAVSPNHA